MALTRRGDGTGAAFQVNSAWWNDYYDLLTGAMTNQPVTIANTITSLVAAVPGTITSYLQVKVSGEGNGRASVGLNNNGSGNLRLGNSGGGYAVELTTDGTTLLLNGKALPIQGSHSAGQPKLSYGTGVPAALDANEIYFQVA